MIRCATIGVEPSELCEEVCVLAYKCEALKAWRREQANNKWNSEKPVRTSVPENQPV